MPSNFNSPIVGSAYYYRGRGAQRTVCRSTGYSLLTNVQANAVQAARDNGGSLPTAGGQTLSADQMRVIDGANVAAGPGWDDLTLRMLYAFVLYSGATAWLPAIAADLLRRNGPLSERTMKAAVWVAGAPTNDAGLRIGEGSPDNIVFEANTIFPTYGQIPPLPANRTVQLGSGDCSPISEGSSASDPITTTATFGASPLLIIALIGVTVIAIGAATRGERSNPYRPSDDELEWRRRQSLPGVKTTWMPSPRFEEITLMRHGQYVGMRKESHRDGYVTYDLPPMQQKAAMR